MNRLLIVAMFVVGTAQAQPVGIFESHGDVGVVAPKPGSVEYTESTGEYRITGGGANMWYAEDAFQFAWKRISGDVSITADVHFVGESTQGHRKAVLMIRQDLTPGSQYADVAWHGDGLTALQFRLAPGAQTAHIEAPAKAPSRIRIERHGNRFTFYTGAAGHELTAAGSQTVELNDPVYVGIGVCSHEASRTETAIFSNVVIK